MLQSVLVLLPRFNGQNILPQTEEHLESLIGKDCIDYVSKDNGCNCIFEIKYMDLLLFMQHVELKLFTKFCEELTFLAWEKLAWSSLQLVQILQLLQQTQLVSNMGLYTPQSIAQRGCAPEVCRRIERRAIYVDGYLANRAS